MGQEVLLSSREEVRVGTSLMCGGSCRWGCRPALDHLKRVREGSDEGRRLGVDTGH